MAEKPPLMGGYVPQMQGGYYGQTSSPQQQPGQFQQQPGQFQQQPGQFQQQPGQFQQQPGQFQQQPGQFQQQPGQFQQQPGQFQHQPGQFQQQPGQFQQQSGQSQQQPAQWNPANAQQYDGDIGAEDVDENSAVEPTAASAPPPPPVDASLPGYEHIAFTNEVSAGPPPSYEDIVRENATIDSGKLSAITAEESKDALLEYVSQQCCYGKGAVEKMKINDIHSTSAFHYSLETFTEGRSTKWTYVPYSGGFVDGPHMGPTPGPWDIICGFSALFRSEEKKIEVPHTASVRLCHQCFGRGFNRCWRCHGRGRVRCSPCNGSGSRREYRDGQHHHVTCTFCHGNGRKSCMTCVGSGCVRCRECKGFGQLKQYIQLTVKYTNRLSDHIIERSDMPDHLIRDVTGDIILEQIAVRVGPVENFFEQEINQRSCDIVTTHSNSWQNERIIQQRQKLRVIPVYECAFKHKEKTGRFWVYGKQHAVYTKDYPHTCLCCNIL